MKLNATDEQIDMSSGFESAKFKIATSAKAFKILSSNLYSNKIRAVIRELSCNAYDSQIKAKVDCPFEVTLPTSLMEEFSVRDFGTGLSHEDVMELYTTYFASTKSDSNDYVGALGLGSKSPFSYTDTFTVVSFYEGVKRTYCAIIERGEPSINLITEVPCAEDEPSGMLITLPVNSSDCTEFKYEAQYVFNTFDKQPIIKGASVTLYPVFEQNETVAFSNYSSNKVYFVMGNVRYPVIDKYIPKSIKMFINQKTITIKVPIGTLDIAPSREALSYDEDTIAAINKIFSDFVNKEMTIIRDSSLSLRKQIRLMKQRYGIIDSWYIHHIFSDIDEGILNSTLTGVSSMRDCIEYVRPIIDSYGCVYEYKAKWASIPINMWRQCSCNGSKSTLTKCSYIQIALYKPVIAKFIAVSNLPKTRTATIRILDSYNVRNRKTDYDVIMYDKADTYAIKLINQLKETMSSDEYEDVDGDLIIEAAVEAEKEQRRIARELKKSEFFSEITPAPKVKKDKTVSIFNITSNKFEEFDSFEEFAKDVRYAIQDKENGVSFKTGYRLSISIANIVELLSIEGITVYKLPWNLVARHRTLDKKGLSKLQCADEKLNQLLKDYFGTITDPSDPKLSEIAKSQINLSDYCSDCTKNVYVLSDGIFNYICDKYNLMGLYLINKPTNIGIAFTKIGKFRYSTFERSLDPACSSMLRSLVDTYSTKLRDKIDYILRRYPLLQSNYNGLSYNKKTYVNDMLMYMKYIDSGFSTI